MLLCRTLISNIFQLPDITFLLVILTSTITSTCAFTLCRFRDADHTVTAARVIQERLQNRPAENGFKTQVRIGLHMGQALIREDGSVWVRRRARKIRTRFIFQFEFQLKIPTDFCMHQLIQKRQVPYCLVFFYKESR